ncbi:ABC transporter permease [Tunturiibacter gelidiferens]|uniref:ABC transporter permease n=1 Tax=Tunturiibacter gelidiferens TaxID=3069689 RepID=UPI003D9B3F43
MNWIPGIFRRRRLFDELSEEMRLHLDELVERLMQEGLSPQGAQRQARIAFGNQAVIEERSREVWQWPTLESIWADVRLALRQLRRSPVFTVAAVLTLALAIGANAVVFGVLNALILRPLNVPRPQSLFTIERGGDKDQATSYPDYLDLRDRNRTFEALTAYILVPAGLDTGKNPSQIWGYEVAGNYFEAMEVRPYLGRFFSVADEHGPNSAPYLVLSWAYWHSHFQDDRGIVGRVVQVNRHPFTILGVAPLISTEPCSSSFRISGCPWCSRSRYRDSMF